MQTPFVLERHLHLRGIPSAELGIQWNAYYLVSNLTDRPIVIEGFDVQFPSRVEELRLLSTSRGLDHVQGYVAESEAVYRKLGSSRESLFQIGPFPLAAGATRAYGFYLSFDLYQSGRTLVLTDENSARRLLQLAIGGNFDETGTCRPGRGPVSVTLRLSGGRQLRSDSETWLAVVGCSISFSRPH